MSINVVLEESVSATGTEEYIPPLTSMSFVFPPAYYVGQQIKQISLDLLEYSRSLNVIDIIKINLSGMSVNVSVDYELFVATDSAYATKTYNAIMAKFCESNILSVLSIGGNEHLIYNDTNVVGYTSMYRYTDKTFGIKYVISDEYVRSLSHSIKTREGKIDTPILTRLSMDNAGRMLDNNILFNAPKIDMPHKIMYPWFDKSPQEIGLEFMNSSANVLVLYGDPGTGKTTFIKNMLRGIGFDNKRTVNVVDTPNVMQAPELVNYIYTSKHKDIIIFEDVDRHLYSRSEGNDIMAGLLNAAEGLASPDVKIIISTNIKNLADIDSALLRPGRCFKTMEFVKLTQEEQIDVRSFLNLDVEVCTKERQSLAEVMNEKTTAKITAFGFN